MTDREVTVALELRRLAQQGLASDLPAPEPGEPLAAQLDSLQLLALVVAVEDRFRIVLTDEDAAAVTTLEELARLVSRRTEVDLPAAARPGPDGPAERP
jgi:acyl carrier protein